jgi:hypothetical protein
MYILIACRTTTKNAKKVYWARTRRPKLAHQP